MQSSRTTSGRILEIWSTPEGDHLEVISGSDRKVFTTQSSQTLENLVRGDIVHITHNISHNELIEVSRIERLAGPSGKPWEPIGDSLRWRRLSKDTPRMIRLKDRQKIVSAIRESLDRADFLEVETPLLVKGTCPDTHIESIEAGEGYLVTSTEYQIKRLMVGGFENVYTLTKNFRANDRGKYHSTEFTMLEWGRAYGTMEEIEEDAVRLIQNAFQRIHLHQGKTKIRYHGQNIELMSSTWEKLTVREAFEKYLNLKDLGDFSLEPLCAAADKAEIELPEHFKQDKHLVLSFLLDRVQPYLGNQTPTFLREWPAFMTSSARLSQTDPNAAERSELYIAGIEISDGFPFLCDPESQRTFFGRELQRRHEEGKKAVQLDMQYIDALSEGIPPGAGMALGIDRLVMVLTGAEKLSDVQAFDWDEL